MDRYNLKALTTLKEDPKPLDDQEDAIDNWYEPW
jgi:hypothetical protein